MTTWQLNTLILKTRYLQGEMELIVTAPVEQLSFLWLPKGFTLRFMDGLTLAPRGCRIHGRGAVYNMAPAHVKGVSDGQQHYKDPASPESPPR